jgi:hypothetical protein
MLKRRFNPFPVKAVEWSWIAVPPLPVLSHEWAFGSQANRNRSQPRLRPVPRLPATDSMR